MTEVAQTLGRLAGKAAVVLGAGFRDRPGVGASVALRLASEGAAVLAVDSRPGTAARTAAAASGSAGTVESLESGADTDDGAAAIVARCVARFGRLDALVTTSAGSKRTGILDHLDAADGTIGLERPLEEWQRLLDGTVRPVFLAARSAIPAIAAAGGGAIIALTSVAGSAVTGRHDVGDSTAAAAVNQFVRLTSVDHAERGVRCNAVVMGFIDDESDVDPAGRGALAELVPARRFGAPHEVAAVVAFLLSDQAHYISGTCFPVDGGLSTLMWR